MKALILCILSVAFGSSYLQQTPNIGSDCSQGTVAIRLYTFDVAPWPISDQVTVNITMGGVLFATTFINEIWISSTSPGQLNNQVVAISQQYNAGNVSFPFTYTVQYPAATWRVILTVRDSLFNILTCWTFTYNTF